MLTMIPIERSVLIVIRDSLRDKGKLKILSEAEYDALIYMNAKLNEEA